MTGQAGYEWKKVIRRKFFVLLTAGFVLISLAAYSAGIYIPEFGCGFHPSTYRQVTAEFREEDAEVSYRKAREVWEAILYRGEQPAGLSSREAYALYEVLCRELSQVSDYEAYIDGILRNAGESRGGFFAANSENRRLNEKIYRDFCDLQELSPGFTGSYGIACFLDTDLWDVLFVMILMIFVYMLIIAEYEEGKISLMRAAPMGRKACFRAKFLLGLYFVTVLQTSVYLMRFLLAAAAYGCPDLAAPIQSVYGAGTCAWKICIGQALLLFWAGKLFMSAFLYAFLVLLALLCRGGRLFYGICLGGGAAFTLCYTQIDVNSFLEKAKWLNPAAFMDTGRLLTEYRNLSVLGVPFGYFGLAAGIVIVSVPLFVFLAFRLYENGLPDRRKFLRIPTGVFQSRGKGLWRLEHRKYWLYQGLAGAYLAYLLLAAAAYEPVRESLYTKEEIYYKLYVTHAQGRYSEEKLQELYRERMRLKEIEALLETGENYHASVIDYYQKELERRNGLDLAIRHVEYVRKNGDTVLYEKGFQLLLGRQQGRLALFLCRLGSMGMMCLFSVTIWHYDKRTGMDRLIRISMTGDRRLRLYQYGNILWGGCLIFAATYIPWICNVSSVFGCGNWDAAAGNLEMFVSLPGGISLGLLYGGFYGAHLLYLFTAGCAAKWVCGKMNHYMGAALALFAVFMLPVTFLYLYG